MVLPPVAVKRPDAYVTGGEFNLESLTHKILSQPEIKATYTKTVHRLTTARLMQCALRWLTGNHLLTTRLVNTNQSELRLPCRRYLAKSISADKGGEKRVKHRYW